MSIPASRYGTILYGQYKYGSTGTEAAPTYLWGLEVDWDGDGIFDGTNEAGRMTDIDITRGRKNFLQPNGQGFYPIAPGNAKITLDNYDGRYDAWNSSSDLYPNVTGGKDVRIKVIDSTSGSTYSIFYGILSDIVPMGYGSTAIVKFIINDPISYLRDIRPILPLSTAVSANTAINTVLSAAGWASRWGTSLDTSTSTIPYFWGQSDTTAADQCLSIANTFLGYFFASGSGSASYKDRASTSTATKAYTESVILKDISMPQPWENYRDNSKMRFVNIYNSTSTSIGVATYPIIWGTRSDYNPKNVQPNVRYKFQEYNNYMNDPDASTRSVYENYQKKITFPSPVGGVFLRTLLYASSTWFSTAIGSTTSTYFSYYSFTPNVEGALIEIEHNYPSTTVYLRTEKYENLVDIQNMETYYPSTGSTGTKTFTITTNWIQDGETATNIISLIGALLVQQNKFPVIQVSNRPSYQFPELFDKVTLDVPTIGISTESFRVGGLEHLGTPQDLRTTIFLEKYVST